MSIKQAEGKLKSAKAISPPIVDCVTMVAMAIRICVEVGPKK
jgi:hypothetical protein